MPKTTTHNVQILPGSHFLIRGMVKFDGAAPVPMEIDLGEFLDLTGHTVCAVVVNDAIKAAVKQAFEAERVRLIDSAPSRELGPGVITLPN